MPRYIDADKLKQDLSDPYLCNITPRFFQIIDNQPTVNVQDFTSEDLKLLECVLMSAIYDCHSRISVLKFSSHEENYKREQLEINEKSLAKYTALLEKIRGIER